MNFKLEQKVKVLVTYDIKKNLIEILNHNNYSKPMIVIDNFLLNSPIIKETLTELTKQGIEHFIYSDVVPDPPMELIDTGAQLFLENKCDSVVAIGGGSVIDAARGINIVRLNGGKIKEYVFDKIVTSRCYGLISIPTTSGTGSELSNALVITDTETHEKLAVLSDNAVSEYALLNPNLTLTVPKNMTIMTGLDVFSHAAEAYTSNLSSPIIDAICEKIMFLVVKYLPSAVNNPNDLEARERMMVASALGGWVLNNGGTHFGHSLAHVVGAKLNMPHGMACAYSLPTTLKLTAEVKPNKIREIGNILNMNFPANTTDIDLGDTVAKEYKNFRDITLGLPSFETLNISQASLQELSELVLNERFAQNSPFKLTPEVVADALKTFG